MTFRIQIIGPHKNLLLRRRHRKRPHARHDIAHRLPRLKQLYKSLVLRMQPTVPVHFRVIKAEHTTFFRDFDVEIGNAGEELVGEGAEGVRGADHVGFVDYGPDGGVFIKENGGQEVSMGEVGVAQVEVCWLMSEVLL